MAGFNNSRFLKSKGVVAVCYLLGLFVFPVMNLQAELHEIDQLRTHVEKWVETKQLISSESSQWKMDKILLKDMIRLLELDNEELDEIIEYCSEGDDHIDKETFLKVCKQMRLF